MEKPLKLAELLTNEKYKKMDVKQLTYVIDYVLEFVDYEMLNGNYAEGKAVNLHSYFNM
jgi:hypothetical protein